jgi:peroxiredoxin
VPTEPIPADPSLHPLFIAAEQRWLEHWRHGPTRRTWATLPVQAGDPAPDVALRDSAGRPFQLSQAWRDRPALLMFWRHWGCGCGTHRAELLREQIGELRKAGAEVLVIGQGEPERASWYAERFEVPCPVVVDADESAYRAYGLLEMSPWLLLGEPRPEISVFEGWIDEHRAKGRPVADNPFLLPGEFVVDRNGRLVLVARYRYCDDYPDPEALVDSIVEAAETEPGSG